MSLRSARPMIALALALLLAGATLAAQLAAVPADPNFRDDLVASMTEPTALAFTPDGRMLITTQPGQLRVYKDGALLPTPALNLGAVICDNSERGLLGVAVDPQFASNRYIYLYYTFKKNGVCTTGQADSPVNRVARFTLPDSNVVDPASQLVLIDNIASWNGNHNAGDLGFGKDGKLYISVGDGGCDYAPPNNCASGNDAARERFTLLGKILRINPDGSVPGDNPFLGPNSARCNVTGSTAPDKICQETFAWGLRNPFRIAFDPNAPGTRFFINDVGQNTTEEIDEAVAGADYGWNICEGPYRTGSTSTPCNQPGTTLPIHSYPGSSGCRSITGGAFVPAGVWPDTYRNGYLFGDYRCGKIFLLKPNGQGGYTRSDFLTDMGVDSAVHLEFGPYGTTQALYYTTYVGGQVRRISFQGQTGNRAPIAAASADPTAGDLPLVVNFSGQGSSDPDNDPLTYEWDFGDSTPKGSGQTVEHTYTKAGRYTATLTVRDNQGASDTATVTINAGGPKLTIASPGSTAQFKVGETITLRATATDAAGNPLNDSQVTYSWTVVLHHRAGLPGGHTHPFFGPRTGNNLTFVAPQPEDFDAAGNSYLEIRLTATDANGISGSTNRNLMPRKVNLTFQTVPAGLLLEVNGAVIRTPFTAPSWEGYELRIAAPIQPDADNQWKAPNGPPQQTVVTGSATKTISVNFKPTRATLVPMVRR